MTIGMIIILLIIIILMVILVANNFAEISIGTDDDSLW